MCEKGACVMHIPENYLSPSTCGVLAAAMAPVWYLSVQKIKKAVPADKMPLLGIAAAFSFVVMMFNIPLPGGTTGHAVGGTLAAIMLGPWGACLAISTTLLVQALFFGDGGILALGANCFNMAFILPMIGYGVYKLLHRHIPDSLAAAIGGYVGINAAAFAAAVEFGLQPMLFANELGQALYCPYPLSISIPAMMAGHLTIFGLAEAIFTGGMVAFITKTTSQATANSTNIYSQGIASRKKFATPLYALLIAMIVLTPLGLLAEGTAWGEWAPEEIAALAESGSPLGYTPAGLLDGFNLDVLFPDYAVSGLPEIYGYILSAVMGTAVLILVFKLMSAAVAK